MKRGGIIPALAIVALASGCALRPLPGPDSAAMAPEPSLPVGWTADRVPQAAPLAGGWWVAFDDPLVAELVSSATHASASIAQAQARIAQARAELTAAQARALPSLDATAAANRGAVTFGGPLVLRNLYQAQAQATWELDLFGGAARAREAAAAGALARHARLAEARLAVAGETAAAYTTLRHCEVQSGLIAADAESRRETARLVRAGGAAGLQAEATVALAVASASDAASRLEQQRVACEAQVQALAALTAIGVPALRAQLSERTARLPLPRRFAPQSLPAEVLARRPDLAALELEQAAARARIGVAEAARLPQLSLAGNIGPVRVEAGGISLSATSWSLGPSLTLPLFDGGRRRAGVESAVADWSAAQAAWRERARVAVKEVEEALLRIATAARREPHALAASRGYNDALEGARARHRAGFASLIELEDARRSALQADAALADLRHEQVAAWIALYRAIGGPGLPEGLAASTEVTR